MLDNKTIVVTGVGTGLGGQIARLAYREGANIVVAARNADSLQAVADSVDASGERILAVPCDITDNEQCVALAAAAADKFGTVDAFAQVAALDTIFTGLADVSMEEMRNTYEINVIGTTQMVKAVAPHMKAAGGGSVILIGSQASFLPLVPQIAYAASKGALMSSMYYMAKELGPDKIRVNTVVPTYMWGPPLEGYVQQQAEARGIPVDDVVSELSSTMPLGEIPTDEDVAESVVFLASSRARMISGQHLLVNAGMHMP